ncbi:tyrosine-type recombinase/integrase [Nocardia uniformis]|uniref:Tyrosine-type recombinase/integrase n=1 Tax=Nocardia uniformis TaxID=53432 RepID=A0A849CG19_9NOCA|nr:tyrosine-type recombinase/integrase [Nocardia uniformis]NNH75850.1 tyrosine-type recombinase/integrase [Nocardia uniformis]
MGPDLDSLPELLEDFRTELRRQNKSKSTITTYSRDVGYFVLFLETQDPPILPNADALTRTNIGNYIEHTLNRNNRRTGKPVTPEFADRQYRSLQQFCRYLLAEGILDTDPFAKMVRPYVPEKPIPVPPIEDLRKLLAECEGIDFEARRDTAIIRLLADIGPRIEEIAPLEVDGLDFEENSVLVIGKGRRPRQAPFGDKTRIALRRYLRIRKQHPAAQRGSTALWLGKRGPMTGSGIRQIIERRAAAAGIDHLTPHRFRHFFAHNWLDNGGSEQDLMMLAGWRSREMIGRYARATAVTRARDAHRKARLGDRL